MFNQKVNLLESVISVKGSIFWNDGRRRITLKKPITDILEPLEGSREKMAYCMELCMTKQRLLRRINELSDFEVMPVLFYFVRINDKKEVNTNAQMS